MALQFLVRQVRARRDGTLEPPARTVMDFSLIRRQSDAAPRLRPPIRISPRLNAG